MKIIFSTKNYKKFVEDIINIIEEQEDVQKFNDIVYGYNKYLSKTNNDYQSLIESNVFNNEIYLIAGNSNEEFLEMFDMSMFFIEKKCSKLNIIFIDPIWCESKKTDNLTNPLNNRMKILSLLERNKKNVIVEFSFVNPKNSFFIKKNEDIRQKNFFTKDIIINHLNILQKEIGDFVFLNINETKNFELLNTISNDMDKDVYNKTNKIKNKNVVVFSQSIINTEDEKAKWNSTVQKLKENGSEKVCGLVLSCPALDYNFIDMESFYNFSITNSNYFSFLNCLGDEAFQMIDISNFIYNQIIK